MDIDQSDMGTADADGPSRDIFEEADGPLFYALPQELRDRLTAHFLIPSDGPATDLALAA